MGSNNRKLNSHSTFHVGWKGVNPGIKTRPLLLAMIPNIGLAKKFVRVFHNILLFGQLIVVYQADKIYTERTYSDYSPTPHAHLDPILLPQWATFSYCITPLPIPNTSILRYKLYSLIQQIFLEHLLYMPQELF